MKAVIICAICKKPKKESETYKMRILDYTDLQEEYIKKEGKPDKLVLSPLPKIVRSCRTCTKRIGYTVKKKI